jgi:molybdopterin-guanine dinucleotide biosynthesis protein A
MRDGSGYDAIVLAGGKGRRLGGVDKAALEVGGRPLLERVLQALVGAQRIVVVGPSRSLPPGVLGTSERPPGGGPVAGLAAGLAQVQASLVAVLACDLPFVTAATLQTLLASLESDRGRAADGAQLVDESGRRQPLAAIYRTARLRAVLSSLVQVSNTSIHAMLAGVTILDVEAIPEQAWDCDTWADVDRARRRVDEHLVEES